jgi:hypothetical protein
VAHDISSEKTSATAGWFPNLLRMYHPTPSETPLAVEGRLATGTLTAAILWARHGAASTSEDPMTDIATEPPRAHARIVYLGPVSHWEVYGDYGDRTLLDEFRARVLARLVLLPRDDPQFRRNRERIVRDAERERISIEWDLGLDVDPDA